MKVSRKIFALAVAAVLSAPAMSSEIYRWTDKEGNVHYGDVPTEGSQRMAIQSRPTDPARVSAIRQASAEARAKRVEEAEAAAAEGPSPEEVAAAAAEKAEKCTEYRARLEKMLYSRRLYRQDENGERVYLNEDEMLEARERVQNQVEEYCSS